MMPVPPVTAPPDTSVTALQASTKAFKGPQRAIIYEVDENLHKVKEHPPVECKFNPAEYSISKRNSYSEIPSTEGNIPPANFTSLGSQSLTLSLTFDSYEEGTDVRKQTEGLWSFMRSKKGVGKQHNVINVPIQVAFEWGSFYFVAFITGLTEHFTLFTHDGMPVRAKVEVTFVQYKDIEEKQPQNPTSGGGSVDRTWKVVAGDRLDTIAAEVYRDATQWRRIAEHNHLSNPLALRPGQVLRIPIA